MHSHPILDISSPSFFTCLNWPIGSKIVGEGEDRQAESLHRSYSSRKLVSGKGKRSPRLPGCPKAGAALPTSVLTDVCLPCIRHRTPAWECAEEMRKPAILKLPGKLFHELDTAFLNTWKLENICFPHGQSRAQLHQILASIFSPYAAEYPAISSGTRQQH